MSQNSSVITLPDGRRLDVLAIGDPGSPALVMHHGTPADATLWTDWAQVANASALQLVAVSRPGYADSTRLPGRAVVDAAADVAAVLESREAPWFVTAGWSGGGPHALACAAVLADRCRAAATLAGVGPFGEPDLSFLAGMGPENIAEFGAAEQSEAALREWLEANAAAVRTATGASLAEAFGGLVPQVDKDVLVGGFADRMAGAMRRGLARGFDGWIDDDFAFLRPWGFDLDAIRVPVTVWQGDLDLMVPFAHGRWLGDRVPGARMRMTPGHGHISLLAAQREAIVHDLLDRAAGNQPVSERS